MSERPSPEELRRRVAADAPSFVLPAEPPETPAEPRPSATVIVARDGADGLEVFMLERHLKSDAFGGAFVFPGGTVDDRDWDPALLDVLDGLPGNAAVLYDAEPERAFGFLVCAIRETFEEAGVLLARDESGAFVSPAGRRRFLEARRALAARETTPLELARREGLRFAGDALGYHARWITPEWAPRRYDARFFVAAMPEGQEPVHDEIETTASVWIRPAEALRRAAEGELAIIFPTRKMLESVLPFATAVDLVAAGRREPVPPVLPRLVLRDGQPRVILPDGSEHAP